MSPHDTLLLGTAAFVGGALNAVAGGGSSLTFPALVVAGVAPITANATSAVALWPASVTSALAYRAELEKSKSSLRRLGAVSLAGGLTGALLLLVTSNQTFAAIVPFLLLAAALVFTFGPRLTASARASSTRLHSSGAAVLQFVIAVYGGYFGGGMGIVMLAAFAVMGMTEVHEMNALKNALATLINFAAIAAFIVLGKVDWEPGALMLASAALGGYAGARFARAIAAAWVRRFILSVAWSMTAYFFVRTFR